ncbi:serine protease [Streptomyces alkaliphilus]|uniref:Serine protease n=1 Tax=Streptomyces alkaliphilus TaxID=1472722 RepID=A0A7W3TD84_9ACTN|nr:serine protease [Streptomyces alkaliphilus]
MCREVGNHKLFVPSSSGSPVPERDPLAPTGGRVRNTRAHTATDDHGVRGHHRNRFGRLAAPALALASALVLALAPPAPAAAEPETGEITLARLHSVAEAVATTNVGGTAWTVDQENGTVTVVIDETVSDKELRRIVREAGADADALEVERISGTLSPLLRGGQPIYASGGGQCTLGFNVQGGTYALTAGHCTGGYPAWYRDFARTSYLGPTAVSNYPGADHGYISLSGGQKENPSQVVCDGRIIDIVGWTHAYIGMPVTRAGRVTGCRSGSVTGLNFTVNYGGGNVVYNMIRTNICAEPGDSGAPLWTETPDGALAVGILSGGSGNCTFGGTTFYEPISRALGQYGFTIP